MKRWWIAVLLLSSVLIFAQAYNAFRQFTASAPASDITIPENTVIQYHKLAWTKTGTVSTCTVAMDSSPDGTTWTAGGIITGQTCTSNGNSATVNTSANYVRITATALSGGGSVQFTYTGWVQNPSGGGGAVASVFGRTGVVVATSGDYTVAQVTNAASTSYVDNAVAGVNPAVAVQVATTAAGDTSGFIYANGASGVGATLTGSVNTAITIDGVTLTAVGQRVLVKNDTQSPSGAFNGVYSLTVLQTGILAPVLTRAADFNTPSSINNTGAIPVILGTANASTQWVVSSTVTTVGTDAITFAQFSSNPSNIVTQTSNAASGQVCTYTGTNKVCVPATALPNGVTATTQSASDNSTKVATTAYVDGKSTAGVALDYFHCSNRNSSSAATLACNSAKNVTTGDFLVAFCAIFSNDGGTITETASDSVGSGANVWANAITYYGTTTNERYTIAWTVSGSSGADTFTCTSSSAKTFSTMAVFKLTGANGTTPVDVTATNEQGSTNVNLFSGTLTTTSDNDLAFMFNTSVAGTSAAVTTGFTTGFNAYTNGTDGYYIMVKPLRKAGVYTLQAIDTSTRTYSNVAVAFKQ